jgi:hypothetical protein
MNPAERPSTQLPLSSTENSLLLKNFSYLCQGKDTLDLKDYQEGLGVLANQQARFITE